MLFQNPQRVATGDRGVLSCIPDQHNPANFPQIKQPLHVVNANRAGFIQDNQVPARRFYADNLRLRSFSQGTSLSERDSLEMYHIHEISRH